MAKHKNKIWIVSALVFSFLIPAIGYFFLGALVAGLFLIGYLGGFFLWLSVSNKASWSYIRTPYWTALAIFLLLHKVEENQMKFFEVLSEKITGVPVPEVTPTLILGLLVLPLGTWLAIPYLIKHSHPLGYYLAWSYFASFGIVESAHFVFPLMTSEPYGYFPGMLSATFLVPVGFWGMFRLWKGRA